MLARDPDDRLPDAGVLVGQQLDTGLPDKHTCNSQAVVWVPPVKVVDSPSDGKKLTRAALARTSTGWFALTWRSA